MITTYNNAQLMHKMDFPTSLQISSAVVLFMGALAYWHSDNRLSVILIAGACAVWYVLRSNEMPMNAPTDTSTPTPDKNISRKDALASHFLGRGGDNDSNHASLKLRSELFNMISRLGTTRALRLSVCCPNRLKNAIDAADEFFRAADGVLAQRNKKRGKRKLSLHMQTLKDMRTGALNAFHGMHFVLSSEKDITFLHRVVKTLRIETLNTMIAVVSSFGGSSFGESTTATPISSVLGTALPWDHTYDGTQPF